MLDLVDYQKQKYEDNMGGLKTRAYFCHYDDIITWPNRDAEPGALVGGYGDLVSVSTDPVFDTGKCWKFIDGVLGKNNLASAGAGEVESRSSETSVVWQLKGINEEALGFLELMKNEWMAWLIPDRNGKIYMLGSEGLPAVIAEDNAQSGGTPSEERMTKFTIRYEGFKPRIFKGTISLTPAV